VRIAQVAPLFESVPPRLYGGTERVVSWLTEELVRRGHKVTLFASGDSVTGAELVPCCREALRLDPEVQDPQPYHLIQLEMVRRRAAEFDVLHFHTDLLHFPLTREFSERTVTTLHGRLDLPDLAPFYSAFPDMPLVSISEAQRRPLPDATWVGNVPHGLPRNLLPWRSAARGDYLAFLGRISPEKGPDRAIEIATRAGVPLKIAAKIDEADRDYWMQTVEPMIRGSQLVEFVGEVDEHQKADFLGHARALLLPIDWPEPFGLVMIEAMSCGTPVIAFRHGSVPEVVEHGVSGLIVGTVEEAVAAVREVGHLDRKLVRRAFEHRFTVEVMARSYLEIYEDLAGLRPSVMGKVRGVVSNAAISSPVLAGDEDQHRIRSGSDHPRGGLFDGLRATAGARARVRQPSAVARPSTASLDRKLSP
jgi:glycosyltransferase involved in cell wall biosynthesis